MAEKDRSPSVRPSATVILASYVMSNTYVLQVATRSLFTTPLNGSKSDTRPKSRHGRCYMKRFRGLEHTIAWHVATLIPIRTGYP